MFEKLDDDYQVNPILTNSAAAKSGGPVLAEGAKRPVIHAFDLDNSMLPGSTDCGYAKATTKECRNRVQDYLLGISDQACNIHRGEIMATAAEVDLGFSSLTTILGGLGAIVTGETAARTLAGAAGVSSGIHSNIRSTVYQNMLTGAILKKIDEQRNEMYRNIVVKQELEPAVYTREAMLRDVVAYHDRCAFYSGVSALVSGDTAPSNADQIRGKIASLRREITDNDTFAASHPTQAAEVKVANERLARAISHLSGQLAIVELGPQGDGMVVKKGDGK